MEGASELTKDAPAQSPTPPPAKKKKSYRKKVECDWLHENVTKLIIEVETRRSLWDLGCAEYKLPKEALWQEVADALQASVNECKAKWTNLRTTFNSTLEKYRKKKSGQATNETIPVSWKYFQQMLFLESNKVVQSTQSTSSLKLDSAVDDDSFLKNVSDGNMPCSSNFGKRLKRKVGTPLSSSPDTSQSSDLKLMAVEALKSMQQKKKSPNTALCEYMAIELDSLTMEQADYARTQMRRAFNEIMENVTMITLSQDELPQEEDIVQYGDSNLL